TTHHTKHFPPPPNLALDKVQNSTYTSRRLNSRSLSSQSYLRAFDRPHQNGDNNQQSHYIHTELPRVQSIPLSFLNLHSFSLLDWRLRSEERRVGKECTRTEWRRE